MNHIYQSEHDYDATFGPHGVWVSDDGEQVSIMHPDGPSINGSRDAVKSLAEQLGFEVTDPDGDAGGAAAARDDGDEADDRPRIAIGPTFNGRYGTKRKLGSAEYLKPYMGSFNWHDIHPRYSGTDTNWNGDKWGFYTIDDDGLDDVVEQFEDEGFAVDVQGRDGYDTKMDSEHPNYDPEYEDHVRAVRA